MEVKPVRAFRNKGRTREQKISSKQPKCDGRQQELKRNGGKNTSYSNKVGKVYILEPQHRNSRSISLFINYELLQN